MKNGSAFVKDGDEIRCAICGNVCGKGRRRVRMVKKHEPGIGVFRNDAKPHNEVLIWWFCNQACRDRLGEVKSADQVAECIAALKFG